MQNPGVKIGIKKWPERFRGLKDPGRAMKRKITRCAIEAGVISVGIHLLLFFFAGSVVVWNVVHKPAAVFKQENIEHPVLERRAAQLPVKIREQQRKGPPAGVTTRVVSAAALPFTLPSMSLPIWISGRSAAGKRR